jgi:hypothetical protein
MIGVTACGFPRPAEIVDAAAGSDARIEDAPIDAQPIDALPIDGAPPHVPYLEPRYLPDICDAVATMPAFTVDNAAGFDTDLDAGCSGGVVTQDAKPDICILRYGEIHITSTGTFVVSGTRALALVADSEIAVEGVLDVAAKGSVNGPGGGTITSGTVVTGDGGGGAGFATAGAAGGSASADGGGGTGGGAATDPALVTLLIGGTRPVAGRLMTLAPASGGAGGAVTLIACRGQVSVIGTIDAGGGGGLGGKLGLVFTDFFAGTGGGSGGNVVLQGMSITVTGQVFANGGGGGAGAVMNGSTVEPGRPGANGTRSTTDVASGGSGANGAGSGGTGGRQGAAPGPGTHSVSTSTTPGGGGGSIGFFQAYAPMGVTPVLTPSAASPLFRPNKTVNTR